VTANSRRAILKLIGLGTSALYLPGLAGCRPTPTDAPATKGSAKSVADPFQAISPIDRTLPEKAPLRYSGDDPGRAHRILWDKPGYVAAKGGLPEPSEKVPLAIVGGGLSGLASAYLLRKYRPVVLERAERFGGNSRGESWRGVDYAIGAAYFVKPETGTPIDGLIRELKLGERCRERTADDPVVWNGKRHYAFWDGETDPAHPRQFQRLKRHFRDVLEEKNGWFYPDIPVTDPALRKKIDALDGVNFLRHLEQIAGGRLHPHVETAIEHFCWSSFGASGRVVSAACGLNFYAAEFESLMVCPGGNSAVAEALLGRLAADLPYSHLRTSAVVIDARVRGDGVQVSYEDAQGNFRSLLAQAVILACPKFAVAKLLHEIEEDRLAAIGKLRYNAYLVANVLLKDTVKDDFYDLFLLGEGQVGADLPAAALQQKATDVVLASYARPQPDRAALTLYRAIPHEGGRSLILGDDTLPKYRSDFQEQIEREILPLVGRSAADVVDIRVARWGHPLPVAASGLIASGLPEALRKPFRGRVFFVEQDNWALPAFETAVTEALLFAPQVEKALIVI
jgi:protoporphyrinogen/coproporphyrinogen III oxidase